MNENMFMFRFACESFLISQIVTATSFCRIRHSPFPFMNAVREFFRWRQFISRKIYVASLKSHKYIVILAVAFIVSMKIGCTRETRQWFPFEIQFRQIICTILFSLYAVNVPMKVCFHKMWCVAPVLHVITSKPKAFQLNLLLSIIIIAIPLLKVSQIK